MWSLIKASQIIYFRKMDFIGFILLLLLFLILVPVIRVVIAAANMRRRFKQAMGGFGNPRSGNCRGEKEYQTGDGKKVYAKDDGEYVSFEEIKVEETTEERDARRSRTESVRKESQITDVEFEEL